MHRSRQSVNYEVNFTQYFIFGLQVTTEMLGDPLLRQLKKGDIIQLQRRGFFICDEPYRPPSPNSGVESPCVLFNIPDGHTKEMPNAGSKQKKKAEGPTDPQQPAKKRPPAIPEAGAVAPTTTSGDPEVLKQQIDTQGGKVRDLKSSGADKVVVLCCDV